MGDSMIESSVHMLRYFAPSFLAQIACVVGEGNMYEREGRKKK